MAHGRRRRLLPRRARRLQVLRLLHEDVGDVLDTVGLGNAAAAADDRAPDRGQLLQLPGDHLHRRRQAAPGRAGLAAGRRDLPQLLPPPRRRADRPRQRVPAAAEGAARPEPGRRRGGAGAGRDSGWSRRWRSPTTWRARSWTPSSPCRRPSPRRTRCSRAYAYAAQIYCDFSGYTDMAIGLALLMGFVFPQNFNSPYRATGFRDFWRRWHMTLSRFLRDYLYIPLGGNRKGRVRTYVNLMLTMTLGGLWHGASWNFVLWGDLPGRGARGRARERRPPRPRLPRLAALVRRLQPRRLRLDPVPLPGPRPVRRLRHARSSPAARRRSTACRSSG